MLRVLELSGHQLQWNGKPWVGALHATREHPELA